MQNIVERLVRQFGNRSHIALELRPKKMPNSYNNKLKFVRFDYDRVAIVPEGMESMPKIYMTEYEVTGVPIAYNKDKQQFRTTVYLDEDSQTLLEAFLKIERVKYSESVARLRRENIMQRTLLDWYKLPFYKRWFKRRPR